MAVDDAGLAKAEVHLAPGDVEWNEDLGRFKARVEQLLMGDVKHLPGLIPLLPNPKAPGFDAAVQSAFEAFASTWRQEPLLRARDVETTDGGVESDAAEVAGPAPALPPPQAPGAQRSEGGGGAGGFAAAPQSPLPAATKANRKRPVSGSSAARWHARARQRSRLLREPRPWSRPRRRRLRRRGTALAPAEQPSCDLAALVRSCRPRSPPCRSTRPRWARHSARSRGRAGAEGAAGGRCDQAGQPAAQVAQCLRYAPGACRGDLPALGAGRGG